MSGSSHEAIKNAENKAANISVGKARPVSVANPNTQLQQEQRLAMKQIAAYLRSFGLENVRLLNNSQAVRMSGYNRCVKNVNTFKPGNELSGHVKCLASGSYVLPSFSPEDTFIVDDLAKTCAVKWDKLFNGTHVPSGVKAMVTVQAPDGLSCTPAVYVTATSSSAVIDLSKFESFDDLTIGACYIAEDGLSTSRLF
jgi:hypothetical protein